ncbi:MAG: hypothetical protein AMJ81_01355 [Phycisphaerae bacterium SM23_33]|nr:MAG: hypothetical protein AMJ81_01355 [Phycisphaerae bacterium SM23_33]
MLQARYRFVPARAINCARRFHLMPVVLVLLAGTAPAAADIWNVSDVPGLNAALSGMGSGDEIILAPGTYNLTRVVAMNTPNVTICGASGNRDDVILIGGGMNTHGVDEGITIEANNVHVYDLTLKDFFYNALHLRAESDITGAVISNVKTWNVGERHIKGSWDNSVNHTCDNALIENVYMLQTEPRLDTNPSGPDYIGGMDIMATNNLIIRDCVAEGIYGAEGGGNAAIFLWQGVNNMTVERNLIVDCAKGIGVGLCYEPGSTISGGWHADGGAIRNNFIVRTDEYFYGNNIGLELCAAKNLDAVNNTIYSPTASYFRTLSLWDSANRPNTDLEVVNNIVRGGCWYNGDDADAAVAAWGNIVDGDGTLVLPEWFVDALNGDLHLTELATAAINNALVLADVTEDVDGGPRPAGDFPDIGADEYGSPAGDANYDGRVDGLDYNVWSLHYQQAGNWGDGNFNGDALVDGLDYNVWSLNYGFGEGALPVPEPAGIAVLALGAAALAAHRRRGASR